MPDSQKIKDIANIVLSELMHTHEKVKEELDSGFGVCEYQMRSRLLTPFVAYAETNHGRLFLCPGYTPLNAPEKGGKFVGSYYAPIGRIFALNPGDTLSHKEKSWRLDLKHAFEPVNQENTWDAKSNTLSDADGHTRIGSLRDFLIFYQGISERDATRELDQKGLIEPLENKQDTEIDEKSKTKRQEEALLARIKLEALRADKERTDQFMEDLQRESVSLKGKEVLDAVQDAVMRSSPMESLILEGLPGTGKTTTTIKLIAKQCYYDENGDRLPEGRPWRLYVPTEILKDYVKEAFNRENIPASTENVTTWDADERILFARDIFRFLKIGNRGVFRIQEDLDISDVYDDKRALQMLDSIKTSLAEELQVKVEDEAGIYQAIQEHFTAYQAAEAGVDSAIREISAKYAWEFADITGRVSMLKGVGPDGIFRALNELARLPQAAIKELHIVYNAYRLAQEQTSHPSKGSVVHSGDTEITKKTTHRDAMHKRLNMLIHKLFSSKYASVIEIICERGNLPIDGRLLYPVSEHVEKLDALPEYAFRNRDIPEYIAARYVEHAKKHKGETDTIASWEVDVIIYGLLRLLLAFPRSDRNTLLSRIHSRIVDKIVIDEATDFSPIQIRTLRILCTKGLVLSGDLMQRATLHGLKSWEDTKLPFKIYNLSMVYRQNPRLLTIAKEIHRISTGKELEYKSYYPATGIEYPAPRLIEAASDKLISEWVCSEIVEIVQAEGSVRATAIFVRSKEDIDYFADLIEPCLRKNSMAIERCYEGRMSQTTKIGIFQYRHIKGLEFETAFLIHPDAVPESLMGMHLYIGATRATKHLRVACKTLPSKYKSIKNLVQITK